MRKSHRRLPLTALRTFEAAARRGSFKDAAEELSVSRTTVSNQIRQLERDWGCQLFIRKTRQVVLTDEGRSLSRVISRAFDAISNEIDRHVSVSRKRVSLAVGPIFGSRWLTPRLERFRKAHPDIELMVHHGPRITGVGNLADSIAVDWGHGDWAGLEAEWLLEIRYAPVLSPSLAEAKGGVSNTRDLARFPVLHQHDRTEWSAWFALAGVPELDFSGETVIEDANVVTQAAIDGQGVVLGVFPFIQNEVDAGRLLKPFEIELSPTRAFYVLTRPGARRTPEIAAVCDWLLQQAKADRAKT